MVFWNRTLNRILIPAIAAMGLFACNRPDPVSPAPDAATGSARVALPALPADYLAGAAAAWFRLDITGPDMAPIFVAETLYVGRSAVLEVNGIPPGTRVFHGVLYRIDSAGQFDTTAFDTTATHEGSTRAVIQAGATASVALFLKSTASGSAHVCLQVEGWPVDSSCVKPPPPPPPLPYLGGCYALTVTKKGPRQDTLFQAKLSITEYDSSLFAVATWKSGAKDSALGYAIPGARIFYLGLNVGQFQFQGDVDSNGTLRGYFQDSARGIFGNAVAVPALCDSAAPPPPEDSVPVLLDKVGCWRVQQTTVDGRVMEGSLWAGWQGASVQAWFQWNGVGGFAMDNDSLPATGSTLYLFGTLPGGFGHPARSAIEIGHYKAKIAAGGNLESGAAYARVGSTNNSTSDKFADWTGTPVACPERAYPVIADLFR
jgi:hypothetical protein